MKKLVCMLAKLFALLAVLGALVYAAVLYWDKIMELLCKLKGMLGCKDSCCCCDDESEDYADWEV
ncbi:hypothetical protein [Flavonifractor sp. HCP28S3_F3]|uniref:hypothetical protein n=1 Tax=Flavonifractor sp. HCP28S3_F3 TaxID=3438939 RepID=UPI003F88FB08